MALETITIQPGPDKGDDTYVASASPNNNIGTLTSIYVGTDSSAGEYRSLLRFDLSEIPLNRVVQAAELTLSTAGSFGSNTIPFALRPITSPWQRLLVTWNTQPTYASEIAEAAPPTTGSITWTGLGQLAQSWREGTNLGVVLVRTTTLTNTIRNFASSRHATAELRPKLVVTTRLAATATPMSPVGTEQSPDDIIGTTPRLNWNYSSPDAGAQQRYQVRIFDDQNNLIYTSAEVASASKFHDIPAAAQLQYGQVYHWQVRAYDGAWGPWSTAEAYFRPVLPAPQNLIAEPSPENATIALEWEGNEAATGYHVYRKNAASGDYRRINLAMLTAPEYVDSAAASGAIYDYAVVAVAENGYESPLSDPVQASVIFTGTFIDDLRLEHEPTVFHPEIPFVGSSVPVLGRPEPTVHRRQSSRTLRLEGICTSRAELQAIVSRLAAPGNHRYVDAMGEVMRFEVTSAISFPQHRPYDPQNPVYFWSVTVTEVA